MNFHLKKNDTYDVYESANISLSQTHGQIVRACYIRNSSTGAAEMATATFRVSVEIYYIRSGNNNVIYWVDDVAQNSAGIFVDYSGYRYGDYDPGRGYRPTVLGDVSYTGSVNVTDDIDYPVDEYFRVNNTCTNNQTINQRIFNISSSIGNRQTSRFYQAVFVKAGMNCPQLTIGLKPTVVKVSGSSSVGSSDPVISFSPCEWSIELDGIYNPSNHAASATDGTYSFKSNAKSWTINGQTYTIPKFTYERENSDYASLSGSGTVKLTGLSGDGDSSFLAGEIDITALCSSDNSKLFGRVLIQRGSARIVENGLSSQSAYLQLGTVQPAFIQDVSIFSNPRFVDCQLVSGQLTATGLHPHIVYELNNSEPFRFPFCNRYFSCNMSQNGTAYFPRIYVTSEADIDSTSIVTGSVKSGVFEIRVNRSNGLYDTLDSSKYMSVPGSTTQASTVGYYVSNSIKKGGYSRQPISNKTGLDSAGFGISISDSTIYSIIVTVPVSGQSTMPEFNFRLDINDGFWTTPTAWSVHTQGVSGTKYYRHSTFISNDGSPVADIYSQAPPQSSDPNIYNRSGSDETSCVTTGVHEVCVSRKLAGGKVKLIPTNCIYSIDYNNTNNASFNFNINDGGSYPTTAISKDFNIGIYLGTEGSTYKLLRLLMNIPELIVGYKEYDPFGSSYYKPVISDTPLSIGTSTSVPISDSGYYITYIYDRNGNYNGTYAENYTTLSAQANFQSIMHINDSVCTCSGCICHGLGFNGEK